ncbi:MULTISPECIES: suppressor of fused domain protein [unclassified Duganella]|uniref:suppressor of fused domain protein n=1 Tax=unclassified Duganella TaxID=2636909 RepID=UPI0006FC9155|nr:MULTISPECIES: suppressor of fused domain protein [unclassified Duganella]KQV55035.1 riboflavin biosynthesis protein [Duganella sp. Root336D2]KRB94326.1 riboflavin biosynthesis protein [Duganella sp. Root198D2]
MDLTEYKTRFSGRDDAAPGWDAIEDSLKRLYGEQEPWHWGTVIKGFLGGPDPIDGVSAYQSNASGTPHFHFCSFGFTSLYYDEQSVGKDFSRFGFELTFRLANKGETQDQLVWVCSLIQNLGRYIFQSGKWFEEYHWIPANGPIYLDSDTDLVGLVCVLDPELQPIDTPHGRVEFLQLVGITSAELEDIKANRRTSKAVADSLREGNPLLITDLGRRST